MTAQARAGNLPAERLTGGTFTLNNYGVFGVDGSTPIINHPEAALLGVGRIFDKPVGHRRAGWRVRKVTQLSLTFDHRVCDGGVAGGFLRASPTAWRTRHGCSPATDRPGAAPGRAAPAVRQAS